MKLVHKKSSGGYERPCFSPYDVRKSDRYGIYFSHIESRTSCTDAKHSGDEL